MKIVKQILLAFPVFLASLLLVVSPAQASRLKATPAVQMIVVTSTQANLDIAIPQINSITHSVIEQTGCSCTNCVQANLHKLQGKLPMVDIF
jgi:flavin reductase (DIM6/NTAB) family NADH-FMN oxidoreductase RutF